MFRHMQFIGLSVGLLVILSGLSGVSLALARHEAPPAPVRPAAAVTPQSAEASLVTAAALRSIGID